MFYHIIFCKTYKFFILNLEVLCYLNMNSVVYLKTINYLTYFLLKGVPVAFHEGANSCKIKVIIQELLNSEDVQDEICLDDCVPIVEDDI